MSSWSLDVRSDVAVLTFTREPDNQIDLKSMAELGDRLEALGKSTDTARVVMLTGGLDGYFIKHADIADLGRKGRGEVTPEEETAWRRTLGLLESIPQPTVAAVDGQSWGGGVETALACTLRIASERAHFSQPEIKFGIIPGGGGTQRLPRVVGTAHAADLILSGRVVQAAEAHRMGLVNAVLPTAGFAEYAFDWCRAVAANPAPALFAAKRAVLQATALPLADGLALERSLFDEVVPTSAFGRS